MTKNTIAWCLLGAALFAAACSLLPMSRPTDPIVEVQPDKPTIPDVIQPPDTGELQRLRDRVTQLEGELAQAKDDYEAAMGVNQSLTRQLYEAEQKLNARRPVTQTWSAEEMLRTNNAIRARANRRPQALDSRLCASAQEQADWCAAHGYTLTSNGSAHEFGNGTPPDRAARHGFRGSVAENMAGNSDDVQMAFRQWQESPGHARTLFADYDRCGFGMKENQRGERLWFAVYGSEQKQPSVVYRQQASVCASGACSQRRGLFGRAR